MKTFFVHLLIVLLLALILRNFMVRGLREGLSSCTPDKQNLVYQNTAAIEQQQKDMDDFEKTVLNQVKTLGHEVSIFAGLISKNAKRISTNKKEIESSVRGIKNAAAAKNKELDKISFG